MCVCVCVSRYVSVCVCVPRYVAGVRGKGVPPSPTHGSLRVRATSILCANNSRNALSVIACVHCLFEACTFAHTRGAEPMAGVDLEPDGPADSLHNITFRGCVCVCVFVCMCVCVCGLG